MRLPSRKRALNGEVCTIHLMLAGAEGKQFDDLLRETLQPARPQLEQQLKNSLAESFGPNLKIDDLRINREGREILIRIDAVSYGVKSCGDFEKALTRFVLYMQDVLNRVVRDKLEHTAFRGRWFPAPPLIRMQFDPPEKHRSVVRRLQQPLVILILGTLLGSALIPWIQARSNLNKVRHDERIKLALAIIDQNTETNSRLVTLRSALELFAKDHVSPKDASKLARQQEEARERYNLRYLSFDEQAWWWYWATQMKAQLSALATPDEARRIQSFAAQYDKKLQECVSDLVDPWNKLLREKYDPANWKTKTYETLLDRSHASLDKHIGERDALALEMSQVFASE